jgi:hypothetical protein
MVEKRRSGSAETVDGSERWEITISHNRLGNNRDIENFIKLVISSLGSSDGEVLNLKVVTTYRDTRAIYFKVDLDSDILLGYITLKSLFGGRVKITVVNLKHSLEINLINSVKTLVS